MKRHRVAWITAAAVAVAPLTATPASAACLPARALAPADVTAPTVIKHVNTDMDGDGSRDSVTLTYLGLERYLGTDQFELSVTTTKGRTAKAVFSSNANAAINQVNGVWQGADAIDGHKGSELLVSLHNSLLGDDERFTLGVYTWRSGKLVAEKAPAAPGTAWQVGLGDESAAGYRFFTSHGHRYADASRLKQLYNPTRWKGTVTRSVWQHDKWVKVSQHRAKATGSLTWGQLRIAGPNLLAGQISVDVSGDGQPDLVLYYQDGLASHRVTVLANNRRAVVKHLASLLGTAEVDGVAGAELVTRVNDSHGAGWKVFAWRHGSLTELAAPALYGDGAPAWYQVADSRTNVAVSVESGDHYVVTGWISRTGDPAVDPVHYARSVWEVDHWKKLSVWTAVVPVDQLADFDASGFTAPGLVSP
jgi:hypothetical protein